MSSVAFVGAWQTETSLTKQAGKVFNAQRPTTLGGYNSVVTSLGECRGQHD